ncbi:MAG: hypothetical protein WCY72_06080, partial [Lysobacteraceae bacterium]
PAGPSGGKPSRVRLQTRLIRAIIEQQKAAPGGLFCGPSIFHSRQWPGKAVTGFRESGLAHHPIAGKKASTTTRNNLR